MDKFKKMVVEGLSFLSRNKVMIAALLFSVSFGMFAQEGAGSVTIPVIGVSVQDYITACITLMGTVAGTAVGGYAAFLVVKKALKWLGRSIA